MQLSEEKQGAGWTHDVEKMQESTFQPVGWRCRIQREDIETSLDLRAVD